MLLRHEGMLVQRVITVCRNTATREMRFEMLKRS